MKFLVRVVVLFALLMSPAFMATAQTPEATSGEPSSFASGINQPATFFDDRGNPIFAMLVTGVERDWQSEDEYTTPERGMIFVKVDFSFTNLSDRPELVSPYALMLVDNMGLASSYVWISDDPGIFTEDVNVDAGEMVEGSMVYAIYADLEPMMIVWQPDYSLFVFIHLGE